MRSPRPRTRASAESAGTEGVYGTVGTTPPLGTGVATPPARTPAPGDISISRTLCSADRGAPGGDAEGLGHSPELIDRGGLRRVAGGQFVEGRVRAGPERRGPPCEAGAVGRRARQAGTIGGAHGRRGRRDVGKVEVVAVQDGAHHARGREPGLGEPDQRDAAQDHRRCAAPDVGLRAQPRAQCHQCTRRGREPPDRRRLPDLARDSVPDGPIGDARLEVADGQALVRGAQAGELDGEPPGLGDVVGDRLPDESDLSLGRVAITGGHDLARRLGQVAAEVEDAGGRLALRRRRVGVAGRCEAPQRDEAHQ